MDIVEIFYKNIIPEAQNGRIDCLSYYNVIFSTRIYDENKFYSASCDNDDIFIPTLIIKNKKLFDQLLIQYVDTAMSFYDDINFDEEILDYKMYDKDKRICKEKVILALLFSNATVDDFNNPIEYLKNRINFMNNCYEQEFNLGYSEYLDADMMVEIKKDIINNETPFQFIVKAISDSDEEFVFPKIKFGITGDNIYIYAIQNERKDDSIFGKKINRKFYKVGIGYIEDDKNDNESLKDITASFLISLNIAMSYFKNIGGKKIVVPSILIERWNAKNMANFYKAKKKNLQQEQMDEIYDGQIYLQRNLSDKLVRTFLRLGCHYNIFDVFALPYEDDSSLHININDNLLDCNNPLLLETFMLMEKGMNKNKIHK